MQQRAIAVIARLSADIGIPQHLGELGVKESDFPHIWQKWRLKR